MAVMAQSLVVVQGPTAVGKTVLGIELAEALNGEIISADSRQIYRQMDIGTAKPTNAERERVPHHLIDVVNPDEDFSLADFLKLSQSIIGRLHQAGRLPLVVGGTGQYITALLEGWTVPNVKPDRALRTALEAEADALGTAALYERLTAVDPGALEVIHPHNLRRIIRALEVYVTTGIPYTMQRGTRPPEYHVIHIGLEMERDVLYARADARFDMMLAQGFLDEVRRLFDVGYARHLPSMSGLGYAELGAHLLDGEPLEEAVQRAKFNTHNFIRRQMTWFRGHDRAVRWFDPTRTSGSDILQYVQSRLVPSSDLDMPAG